MKIGYHASHEQFAPSALRDLAVAAQAAGFQAIKCSDHFQPWSARQADHHAALRSAERPEGRAQ